MIQATQLQTKPVLVPIMDQILAQRPEWRFLQQQRHLKDITRLMIRQVESLCTSQNDVEHCSHQLEKALTYAWIGLLIAQEMQLPPQLTGSIFADHFFRVCQSAQSDIAATTWTDLTMFEQACSLDAQTIQNVAFGLTAQLYRLEHQYLAATKPWYLLNMLLPFLNHQAPKVWLNRISDMMLVLHHYESITHGHVSFSKPQLNAHHPLRKTALKQQAKAVQQFQEWDRQITAHIDALHDSNSLHRMQQTLYSFAPQTTVVGLNQLCQAIIQMQQAWHKTQILKTSSSIDQELKTWLFDEAKVQKDTIAHEFKPLIDHMITRAKDVDLAGLLVALFALPA